MARQRKYTFRPDCEGLEGRQLLSTYEFINKYSGMALEAFDSSTIYAGQATPTGSASQQWVLRDLGNGQTEIQSADSGQVLVDPHTTTGSNGGYLSKANWTSASYQRWQLIPLGDGSYEIRNVGSGKVMEDKNYSTDSGVRVDRWDWNRGTNQEWIKVQVT
jgi:Ricin-type beta-trefoil lectin domain-like